jgi:hypothetical protein
MIIRIFLGLFCTALLFLILADVFYELHLQWFADLILYIGDDFLLLACALFVISCLIFCAKHLFLSLKYYFSAQERARRHVFFSVSQRDTLQRLVFAKKKQLLYFSTVQKQKILAKNTQKHTASLVKSILKELQAAQYFLSESQIKDYQQAIKQAESELNIPRLLALQHEISTFHSLLN